jgi:oxygen-dependent protoporphyrinogen oxidase
VSVRAPVVIVGAGLAGLTAATFLEAGAAVAGLARSFPDANGFPSDFGAHFVTNRLAAAVGVSAACRPMPRYGESVWHRGRSASYPFGLMRNPRFVASALAAKAAGPFRPAPRTAAEWYAAAYGSRLAAEVACPITEAWSGAPATELAASVGDKFSSGLPRTVMLRAAARLTGRTVAVGYSSTLTESPHVWHVYPHGGVGALCERLAAEVTADIALDSPVECVYVENGRAVGVRAGGRDVPAAAVVSTAPLPVLAKLVRGTDKLAHLARFRYRPMAFVNLRFTGRGLLPDVVTWTPDSSLPFFRLTEVGTCLPWLLPAGKTLVTADIGCEVGDATWTAPDDALGEKCVGALSAIVPDARQRYLGCRVLRTAVAYPVYRAEYESDRKAFAASSGIDGLVSVGRNGEFAHSLMEDVYWRTRRKLAPLVGPAA